MNLELKLHTIYPLVGPTGSGKTYFAKNVLIEQIKAKYPHLNIQYISSDDLRREVLGEAGIGLHKHDPEMMQVSDQAFKLLDLKLELAVSFPVSAEIIIVDTTGLSEVFRNQLIEFGKKTNYNVAPIVFDFEDREEFYQYNDSETSKYVISKHITKMKKEVLKTLQKTKYIDIFKIRSKDFSDITITVKDYDFYLTHFLDTPNGKEYVVVSDLHGCIDEFKSLIIDKCDCKINSSGIIEGGKIFIVQDYVDKGYAITELLEFIYHNWKAGYIVPLIGNHENYVYKRVTGQIKEDLVMEQAYFNSVPILMADEELKNMFIELFEASKHFYKHKLFFVNHAPCEEKYLGKIDSNSLKKQRNFVYPKRKDAENDEEYIITLEKELSFIKSYKNWNTKPVVWGHVAIKNTLRVGNINMIDTGCVSGGKLTGLSFGRDGKMYFKIVTARDNEKITEVKELPSLFKSSVKQDINLDELEPDDLKRIRYLVRNKVNYIAGTMCPADKKMDDYVLESLEEGLKYYKDAGIKKVILQKKYMGSNSVNYLNRDIEKCYSTSRGGYVVDKRVDLKEEYARLIKRFEGYFEKNNLEWLVINSELMPWSALGKGLIEDTYQPVEVGTRTEYDLLVETGYADQLEKTKSILDQNEYSVDVKMMKHADLIEKYGQRIHETFQNFIEFLPEYISPEDYKKGMDVFRRQLEVFGSVGEPELLPFSILKSIDKEGNEKLFHEDSNVVSFMMVSDDDFCVIYFEEENWLQKAETFFNEVTVLSELEGIVIKPDFNTKYVAPAVKVRNERYLSITYGFDYKKPNKYAKLINRKYIKRKLKASIDEFEIGKKMLEIPYAEIVDGNQAFINAAARMIIDEKAVAKMDPRL